MSARLFLLLLATPLFSAALSAQPTAPAVAADTSGLQSLVLPIRTIDTDDDFSDLLPLRERIGNARVVVLGEATHGEGTTGRAKARMVAFLHQEMGFDVLAWESGLFQLHAMNAPLRSPDVPMDSAALYLMQGGWGFEAGVRPVLDYARTSWRTGRPLEMAGVDDGRRRMYKPSFRAYLERFFERAPHLAFHDEDWKHTEAVLAQGQAMMNEPALEAKARREARAPLERLLGQLQTERHTLRSAFSDQELALAERFITHVLESEQSKMLLEHDGLAWNATRDRIMGESLLWLLDTLYPDRKVIVWAATSHFIRGTEYIVTPWEGYPRWQYRQAGDYVADALGDDLYTIAFTAYGGEGGTLFRSDGHLANRSRTGAFDPAPDGSLEAAAHALGKPYLFIDLQSAPYDHWLRDTFTSVALGRNVNTAPWHQVVDAFFFIDRAEPIQSLH